MLARKPGGCHNGSAFVSVWVIAHSNPSQVPPLLMHVGKWLAALPADKRLACVAQEVEYTLHSPPQKKQVRQNPLWLWNSEKTSPEIQNRGTSGAKKGQLSAKYFEKNCWEPNLVDSFCGIQSNSFDSLSFCSDVSSSVALYLIFPILNLI